MADSITISGLQGFGYHGVLPEERAGGQDFFVDIELRLDLSATNDELAKTVNYAEVCERVLAIVTGEPVDLIETLAELIAKSCLEYEQVSAVKVTVHKPGAPVAANVVDIAVSIERSK